MSNDLTERQRLLNWSRELADPDWCLSVPKQAKQAITQLIAELEPQQVTTEEELDALPTGSVVLSVPYTGQSGQRIAFQRWDDGDWHRGARSGSTHPDNFLPATIIHKAA